MNNRELVDNLCAACAALTELRRRHVKSFGTLIPHVFMGDVLGHVGACLRNEAGMDPQGDITAILGSLEDGMAKGDRETRNVIGISFANDSELEPFFGLLSPMLGPRMRAHLDSRRAG